MLRRIKFSLAIFTATTRGICAYHAAGQSINLGPVNETVRQSFEYEGIIMRSWLTEARRHAAEIHDVVQLAAGATAFAAVLVFVTLSGRSQDDPIVRWMAEVGAMMVMPDAIAPITLPKTVGASTNVGTAGSAQSSSQPSSQPTAALEALAFEPTTSGTARRTEKAYDINTTAPIRY